MAILKNYDKKIKLAVISCFLFLMVCIIVSGGAIFLAKYMVNDVNKKVYLLEGTAPILIHGKEEEEKLEVEAKSHVELFHNLFFPLLQTISILTIRLRKLYI